jgi:hypothetical protein
MSLKQKIKKSIILKSIKSRNLKSPFDENYAETYKLNEQSTKYNINSYYFSGHNQYNSSVYTRIAFRGDGSVEIWFVYKDTKGFVYFNKNQHCNVIDSPISIKCIEVGKLWELTYKGVLSLLSDLDANFDVSAKLTFSSVSKIFDFETDVDPNILATSLSKEKWDKRFRENNKINKQTHYEQQGDINLDININGVLSQVVFPGMKDHSFGYRDWSYMDKHIWLMILLGNGECLNLNMVNYPHMKLQTGYYTKNNKTIGISAATPFKELDGNGSCLPSFSYFIKLTDGQTFNVSATLECEIPFSFDSVYTICEGIGTFVVNEIKARGIIEYGYNADRTRWEN